MVFVFGLCFDSAYWVLTDYGYGVGSSPVLIFGRVCVLCKLCVDIGVLL
jgi:hypothetical protein